MTNYPPGTFAGDPWAPWNREDEEPEARWCDDCQWYMRMLRRDETIADVCCSPKAIEERYGDCIDLIELNNTDATGCDEYEHE